MRDATAVLHRLLKNSVPAREFMLLTDAFRRQLPEPPSIGVAHRERTGGTGEVDCWLLQADSGDD